MCIIKSLCHSKDWQNILNQLRPVKLFFHYFLNKIITFKFYCSDIPIHHCINISSTFFLQQLYGNTFLKGGFWSCFLWVLFLLLFLVWCFISSIGFYLAANWLKKRTKGKWNNGFSSYGLMRERDGLDDERGGLENMT